MNPLGWSASDPVSVYYPNKDTLSRRTLSLLFRHGSGYPYDRLTCIVTTTAPDGYRWRDTVAVVSYKGERLLGLNYDVEQVYRRDVLFDRQGDYRFSFTPLMPDTELLEVVALGVHIENQND